MTRREPGRGEEGVNPEPEPESEPEPEPESEPEPEPEPVIPDTTACHGEADL